MEARNPLLNFNIATYLATFLATLMLTEGRRRITVLPSNLLSAMIWRKSVKNHLLLVFLYILLVVVFGCTPPETLPEGTKTYVIGDTGPAGGIIFYDAGSASNGWQYLEAAPYDQDSAGITWGPSTTTGATGTAIGTGKANTTTFIDSVGATYGYPAVLCDNLVLGGSGDWFLPSKNELIQMLTLVSLGLGNIPSNANYWSSSETSNTSAWCCSSGSEFDRTKWQISRVRAIRQF
jgi:hypothetical protein